MFLAPELRLAHHEQRVHQVQLEARARRLVAARRAHRRAERAACKAREAALQAAVASSLL